MIDDPEQHAVRVCARCRKPAVRCVLATAHLLNGVPTGTSYALRCGACSRAFSLESPGRTVFSVIVACPFLFMGSFFVAGMWSWIPRVVAGRAGMPSRDDAFLALLFASFLGFGIAYLVKSVVRWRNRAANPLAGDRS